MTSSERALLESLLVCSRRYLEFGAGGSTVLAASKVRDSVMSVDSSRLWLDRVHTACTEKHTRIMPTLLPVDLGEVAELGYPKDESKRPSWPQYHTSVWENPESSRADLFLVDGRFRVACFIQTMLHAGPEALVAVHDFHNRPQYHVILEISREVCRTENLSVFVRQTGYDPCRAIAILNEYRYQPA